MKYIILIINFFLIVNLLGQRDSSRFVNHLYLEINPGIGKISYFESFPSNGGKIWIENSWYWIPVNLDFYYRNQYLKAGISSNLWLYYDLRAKVGLNLLGFLSNEKLYLGPYYAPGIFFNDHLLNNLKGSNTFGIEWYLGKFHFDASYGSYFFNDKNDDYRDVRTLNFNVGYAFRLKKKLIDP